MFEGIGNDSDRKGRLAYIEAGKTDTIDSDGSFFNNQVGEVFWKFKAIEPAAVLVFPRKAGTGRVNMSLNHVAIKASACQQTSFQVEQGSGCPLAAGSFFQGFQDGGHPVLTVLDFLYRQANSIVR